MCALVRGGLSLDVLAPCSSIGPLLATAMEDFRV